MVRRGLFATILAPMFYVQLITNPTHGTLIVLERQDLHLQREIARLLFLGGTVAVRSPSDWGRWARSLPSAWLGRADVLVVWHHLLARHPHPRGQAGE